MNIIISTPDVTHSLLSSCTSWDTLPYGIPTFILAGFAFVKLIIIVA
jgi:hypothetical protein